MEPSNLALFWAAVLACSILLYVFLDGFDLGVGVLFGTTRSEAHRVRMMDTIAPFWDGNETWLVVIGRQRGVARSLLLTGYPKRPTGSARTPFLSAAAKAASNPAEPIPSRRSTKPPRASRPSSVENWRLVPPRRTESAIIPRGNPSAPSSNTVH